MRYRTRTLNENVSGSWALRRTYRTNCALPETETTVNAGSATYSNWLIPRQTSSMYDMLSPTASTAKKRAWQAKQSLLRATEPGYKLRQFMPNHPCTHTSKTIKWSGGAFATIQNRTQCSGYNQLWTGSYDNAAVLARAYFGLSDPATQFLSLSHNGSSGAYRKHDWFSLTSDFNEACDSFIPSSMHLGETMFEHGIFVDALKYVINPSRAIKDLVLGVAKLGLKKKNLGTIARIAKGSSNAWLSYNFGVKPAINDLVSALTAHQIVQQRLEYLARGGGSYIPIRVRRKSESTISNSGVPTSYPVATNTTYRKWYISKDSTAVISAWGKVREDLNWKDAWTAYLNYFSLNKVIGLAWELIPFSFVVDWVTDAQQRINELTRFRIGDPFTEIRNLSCSLLEETKSGIFFIPGYVPSTTGTVVKPTGAMQIAEISDRSYSRYLSIPSTSGVVDFSSLGLFQAIASGALIVQRVMR